MSKLKLVSDIHGDYDYYKRLIKDCDYSIQLGDLGLNYTPLIGKLKSTDFLLGGNHDNYDQINSKILPNFLGDFGTLKIDNLDIFYVRGGRSIDKDQRIIGVSWWEQEELSWTQLQECIDLYLKTKPQFVISHECPSEIIQFLNGYRIPPSRTSTALQMMWQNHKPQKWYFGHHHTFFKENILDTDFTCLNICEFEDILIDIV